MITSRTTPRTTVLLWLQEIHKCAKGEKADFTQDKVEENCEPILSMVASSQAAPADKMRELLDRPDFERRAKRYMKRNWCLITGLPPAADTAAREIHDEKVAEAVDDAITTFKALASPVTEITGPSIAALTERLVKAVTVTEAGPHEVSYQGFGTAVILREALGLPGDEDVCQMVTDKDVLANALAAMEQLGVHVTPEAYASIGKEKPQAATPELG